MTPMPPSMAMAIAMFDSVTVSMAALTNGALSVMREVRRVEIVVSAGRKSAYCVTSVTSSKVRPSQGNRSMKAEMSGLWYMRTPLPTHGCAFPKTL